MKRNTRALIVVAALVVAVLGGCSEHDHDDHRHAGVLDAGADRTHGATGLATTVWDGATVVSGRRGAIQ